MWKKQSAVRNIDTLNTDYEALAILTSQPVYRDDSAGGAYRFRGELSERSVGMPVAHSAVFHGQNDGVPIH